MMKYMFGKKADVAITLLVLMTLALTLATLYMFNTHVNKVSSTIQDSRFLDKIYYNEEKINFYTNEIVEKAIASMKGKTKEEFIDNFKKELEKYKKNETYIVDGLSQLDEQLNVNNVEISDKEVSISFNIKIDEKYKEKFIVSYAYNKKFTRNFNI